MTEITPSKSEDALIEETIIIAPTRKRDLSVLLDSWTPLDEELSKTNEPPPASEVVF